MRSANRNFTLCVFLLTSLYLCVIACKDEDKPKLLPEVTTAEVIEITTSTAVSGGSVTSNGNDELTAAGICWSSTNAIPTITNSKTEITTVDESFTGKMEGLNSGSTYYMRAYATNSVGTGYGDVLTFMTGNAAPVATNVTISGTPEVNKVMTGSYTYTDANNDAESGTILQWYRASDGSGTGEIAIVGANASTYVLLDTDEFEFIRFGVRPKAASGNQNGVETKSAFAGPVAVRTTVTFTYNGNQVTYGIITSPVTSRKWFDRNLGAPNAPITYNDYANYGDLFQWGRGADGHQLIVRDVKTLSYTPVNGMTSTLSSTDSPGHSMFITAPVTPRDWRSPQSDDLWQGNTSLNNPCPQGWHIPTDIEWDAEKLNDVMAAFIQLKINYAGPGRFRDGTLVGNPYYWSSSKATLSSGAIGAIAYDFEVGGLANPKTSSNRANGYPCRCISNY